MSAYKIEQPAANPGLNDEQPHGSLLMSSDPLDDSRSDASIGRSSRVGAWILWLLHPKVAIPLLLILSLISAPLVYRTIRLAKVPAADEPFDTKSVLEFVVLDAENAFVEYRAASAVLVPRDSKVDYEEFDKAQSDGWVYATEPVRKWLDANRPFMELWRTGTAKPDAQYCRASELRADTSLTKEIQEAREFSRLVRLEASRLLVEGQSEKAWEWLRTSFRMSRQFGRHGVIIERLVGVAIHSLTAEGMVKWANDPQVTTDLLRRAMRELQDEQEADAAALRVLAVGIPLRDGDVEVSAIRSGECDAESPHRRVGTQRADLSAPLRQLARSSRSASAKANEDFAWTICV